MLARLFSTKQSGDSAERLAEKYLIRHGLKLVARNYRCRHGEIDLIMQDGDTLVFIEVRLRKSTKSGAHDYGGAAASISTTKQARINAAAQHYLMGQNRPPPCRFDALLLNQLSETGIEWIRDAFSS